MKKLLLATCAVCFASGASAATVSGTAIVTDNGSGSFTFVFDQQNPDINGTGDGMTFTNGAGLDILALGTGGPMIQDWPANGGLGVNGQSAGDNLGIGESIEFIFNQAVNILGFTLNGDHTDTASGTVKSGNNNFLPFGDNFAASNFDGVSDPSFAMNLCGEYFSDYCGATSLFVGSFGNDGFNGYVESITIQVAAVPVPASLGFLFAGVAALGFAGKKRRKA